jgi:hypothetical protein
VGSLRKSGRMPAATVVMGAKLSQPPFIISGRSSDAIFRLDRITVTIEATGVLARPCIVAEIINPSNGVVGHVRKELNRPRSPDSVERVIFPFSYLNFGCCRNLVKRWAYKGGDKGLRCNLYAPFPVKLMKPRSRSS